MEKRGWTASGKVRKPGNLFKYSIVALTGLVFAGMAVLFMLASKGDMVKSLLYALICAVVVAVLGMIMWFIYKATALKGKA